LDLVAWMLLVLASQAAGVGTIRSHSHEDPQEAAAWRVIAPSGDGGEALESLADVSPEPPGSWRLAANMIDSAQRKADVLLAQCPPLRQPW
jgi:hypothetical protein